MTFVRTSWPLCDAFQRFIARICGLALLLAITALASDQPPIHSGPTYAADVAKYRAWRVNDDKVNWATLAGLYWLKPGSSATFGTATDNDVILPKGSAPAHAGKFDFTNGAVTVAINGGAQAKIDGKPVTTAVLKSDRDGAEKKPTLLELGHLQIKVIQRGSRTGLRIKDLASPNLKTFRAPEWYGVDPAWRVTATWEPSNGSKKVVVPNVLGDATPVTVPGTAHFTINGRQFSLVPVEGDPKTSMMFVFSDATTNRETYPAGRMVDAGPVQDGKLVIDFNTAYNPPCAVTAYATCPIAPKEDRLPFPVHAGAKYDKSHPHPGKVFVAE